GVRIDAAAVELLGLQRDLLAQLEDAGHRRVLVPRRVHRRVERVTQRLRAVEIRKALAEVDRLVLDRELRHDAEDRRADLGELTLDLHHASRFGRPNKLMWMVAW